MQRFPGDLFSISDKAFDTAIPVIENLRRIRAAGFTHLHLAWKWTKAEPFLPAEIAEWTAALKESGIRVLDAHGCHPPGIDLWSEAEAAREAALALLQDRVRLARHFGGDAVVYHVPWRGPVLDQELAWFLEGIECVIPLCRELGVAIAIENHYLAENDRRALTAAFDAFDAEWVGFTFDPGHALISGNMEWLLAQGASRLKVLHLNDNDALKDWHWCPYDAEGQADWDQICRFLRRSGYRKPLQLEVSWTPARHGSHETFLKTAFESVCTLQQRIESWSEKV